MVTVESLIYLIVEYNKNEVLRELNKTRGIYSVDNVCNSSII